jgi:ATP synthase protein I
LVTNTISLDFPPGRHELEKNFTKSIFPPAMTEEPGPHGNGGKAPAPSLATYAGVGIQFAIAIVLFALGGNWLDERVGSSPLFLILGVFLGGAAAFYSMYRKLMAAHDKDGKR